MMICDSQYGMVGKAPLLRAIQLENKNRISKKTSGEFHLLLLYLPSLCLITVKIADKPHYIAVFLIVPKLISLISVDAV